MASNELTKLRIKADRARRTFEAVEEAAKKVVYKARREWEVAEIAYRDEAELNGLCRICLQPRDAGNHDGLDHVVLAAIGPAPDAGGV